MDGLDAISTFLLKHPREEFARGDLVLAPVIAVAPLVLLVIVAIALGWFAVVRLRGVSWPDKAVLGGLRSLVFLLIGACLLRPTLVLSRAIAQRNVLAVVIDDSRSMAVGDAADGTRLAAVQRAFADSATLMQQLGGRFAVRFFRAGADASPLADRAGLVATATRTDLAAVLADTREALADMPLAGIVLVSDGAQNGSGDLDDTLLRLSAAGVPVHTVGVGTPRFARDVGIDALRLPDDALLGGEAPGEVVLRLRGVGDERLTLSVEAAGRLVGVDTILAPAGRDLMVVPIRIPSVEAGAVPVRVSLTPLDGEVTTLNNQVTGVLRVRDGPEKILHVEGEPRPELPFLRRAIAGDSALQVVSLIRTAPEKHLRLGVDDSLELALGFPTRREELFRYRAIVLGSIEASYFTPEQLRLLQEFVSTRGGGLLALGGRRALAEGGYAGTPVDELLPIQLDPSRSGTRMDAVLTVRVTPTAAGREHPALGITGPDVSTWDSLPELTVVNDPGRTRPGATVLLEGSGTAGSIPLLSVQRYGRGKAGAFLAQDAWRWQLTDRLPDTDATHAAFWQRVMRWTVSGVPDPLEVDATPDLTAPGEPVELRVRVVDSSYVPRDDAQVRAMIVPPDAPAYPVMLPPDLGSAGEYVGRFTPGSAGNHRVELEAIVGADTMRTTDLVIADHARGDPGSMERDDRVLRRIADATGGNAYDIADLERLPEDAELTRSGVTARASSDLWDAPLVFLLFLGLLGVDWAWRRWRGLA